MSFSFCGPGGSGGCLIIHNQTSSVVGKVSPIGPSCGFGQCNYAALDIIPGHCLDGVKFLDFVGVLAHMWQYGGFEVPESKYEYLETPMTIDVSAIIRASSRNLVSFVQGTPLNETRIMFMHFHARTLFLWLLSRSTLNKHGRMRVFCSRIAPNSLLVYPIRGQRRGAVIQD